MPDQQIDIREKILNEAFAEDCLEDAHREITSKPYRAVLNAMDEYADKRMDQLLEWMGKNLVICGHYSSPDGFLFTYKGHIISKEELFQNFL